MHIHLRDLEQYSDEKFVLKGVYKGSQSEAVLLFLKPGQELPPHPHERFEVVLLPKKGTATLNVSDKKQVELLPDCLYYEPAGSTFGIRNTGDGPFEMLILLIRNESVPPPQESETTAVL